MRRLVSLFSLVALIAVSAISFHSDAVAQDATTKMHPIVGTWLADVDQNDPSNALDAFTFNADGSYIEVDANGDVQLGAWNATGDSTANLTIVSYQANDDGAMESGFMIRGSLEVSADGNSFTASFTIEFFGADGSSSGQAGPGIATGTRVVVEAPGAPVMTLDELFSSFGGPPEATPTS